jgi:hypothetical protein
VVNLHHQLPYDIYIGRPGQGQRGFWGNPLPSLPQERREAHLRRYRTWLVTSPQAHELRWHLPELRGKRLGCFCKPKPCHGDILAELANAPLRVLDFLSDAEKVRSQWRQTDAAAWERWQERSAIRCVEGEQHPLEAELDALWEVGAPHEGGWGDYDHRAADHRLARPLGAGR